MSNIDTVSTVFAIEEKSCQNDNPILTIALRYASLGFRVLPIGPMEKGKTVKGGYTVASTDPETIRGWFADRPDRNLAISLASGDFFIVDFDRGFDQDWAEKLEMLKALGGPVCRTRSGGYHVYLRLPKGKIWGRKIGALAPHVDILCNRGHVIVPPSKAPLPDGTIGYYQWEVPLCPIDQLPDPPDWLVEAIDNISPPSCSISPNPDQNSSKQKNRCPVYFQGSRNKRLYNYAVYWWKNGEVSTEEELWTKLCRISKILTRPLLTEDELRETVFNSVTENVSRDDQQNDNFDPNAPEVFRYIRFYVSLDKKSTPTVKAVWVENDKAEPIDEDAFDPKKKSKRRRFALSVFDELKKDKNKRVWVEDTTAFKDCFVDYASKEILKAIERVKENQDENFETNTPVTLSLIALGEMDNEAIEASDRMAQNPDLLDEVYNDLQALGIVGEKDLSLLLWLVGCSRLLDDPLAALVLGPSSSGKSFLLETVGRLFPPETILTTTQITENAWYYLPPGSLKHRLVVLGERPQGGSDEIINANRTWRELISAKELSKVVTEKTPSGSFVAKTYKQEGPVAFLESSTQPDIFDEDATRLLRLFTNTNEEQTREVVKNIFKTKTPIDEQAILQKHFAFQRRLPVGLDIVIPFGEKLAELFPAKVPECRRLAVMLSSLLKTLALVHYLQRDIEGNTLYVSAKDYEIAFKLLEEPSGYYLQVGSTKSYIELAKKLFELFGDTIFETTKAISETKFTDKWVRSALNWLEKLGCVKKVERAGGGQPAKWKIIYIPDVKSPLPPPDMLFG